MKKAKKFTTKRLREKRKKIWVVRVTLGAFVFILISIGSYFLANANFLKIKQVMVVGTNVLSEAQIEDFVVEKITGKYLKIFPKSNTFLYPRSKIEKGLYYHFPRIKVLDVDVQGSETLNVRLVERSPIAAWCRNIDSIIFVDRDCYLLDSTGYIFDEAPKFSGQVFFEFQGEIKGEVLRQYFLDSGSFQRVQNFIGVVESLGVKPIKFILRPDGDYELALDSGTKIIFGSSQDLNKLGEKLSAGFSNSIFILDEEGVLHLEYIDLRFDNKMFFKPFY